MYIKKPHGNYVPVGLLLGGIIVLRSSCGLGIVNMWFAICCRYYFYQLYVAISEILFNFAPN